MEKNKLAAFTLILNKKKDQQLTILLVFLIGFFTRVNQS